MDPNGPEKMTEEMRDWPERAAAVAASMAEARAAAGSKCAGKAPETESASRAFESEGAAEAFETNGAAAAPGIDDAAEAPEADETTVPAPDDGAAPEEAFEEHTVAAVIIPEPVRKKRRKIHEFTPEHDIRYRGPLSYRHFRILGWLCLAVTQAAVLLMLGARLAPDKADMFRQPVQALQTVGGLALPLLLFANFAVILNAREGYTKLLARYGAMILSIMVVFLLVYERYLRGTLRLFGGDTLTPEAILDAVKNGNWEGYFAFNIFVDLFLCTLFMFFLNYVPKHIFRGRALIAFRLMALLPLVYEIGSNVLKVQAGRHLLTIPVWVYPLLTTKPPLTFLAFTVIGLILKKRERRYFRKGNRTREEYEEFWNSNINSWHFSLFTSGVVLVTVLLDVVLFLFMASLLTAGDPAAASLTAEELTALIEGNTRLVAQLGFGESIGLVFIIPLLLLFSYTRKHRITLIDTLIPLGGVLLIIVIYLEGGYEMLQEILG